MKKLKCESQRVVTSAANALNCCAVSISYLCRHIVIIFVYINITRTITSTMQLWCVLETSASITTKSAAQAISS